MQKAPPAPRYSRFVHQLSDFPHIQHLRTELRACRLDTASLPTTIPPSSLLAPVVQRPLRLTDRPPPLSCYGNVVLSVYVTGASRCALFHRLYHKYHNAYSLKADGQLNSSIFVDFSLNVPCSRTLQHAGYLGQRVFYYCVTPLA